MVIKEPSEVINDNTFMKVFSKHFYLSFTPNLQSNVESITDLQGICQAIKRATKCLMNMLTIIALFIYLCK